MAACSNKAIRLAVQALQAESQKLAFDANLYDLGLAVYPMAKSASERRKEIDEAIAELTKDQVLPAAAKQPSPVRRPTTEQMEMFS